MPPDRPDSDDTSALVIVPNNVSLQLTWAEFARAQPGSGAFRAPAVEVLSLWAGRILETSLLLAGREVHPVPERFRLLSLWERVIADADDSPRSASDLAAVAREAMDAERLLVHWSTNPRGALDGRGVDLGERFGRWREGLRRALKQRGWISLHEQMLQLVEALEQNKRFPVALPGRMELRGFPELTRLELRLLAALERHGVEVFDAQSTLDTPDAPKLRIDTQRYAAPEDEMRGAAEWAREQLEQGRARVAVAVNGLTGLSDAMNRVFLQAFHPDCVLTGRRPEQCRFHVSLGRPVLDHPLARTALTLLELSVAGPRAAQPFEAISRCLLSPAWGAAPEERPARARLEMTLREAQRATVSLAEVGERARALACPDLVARIARLPKPAELEPSGSARRFHAWLAHWGWPGTLARGAEARRITETLRGVLEALDFGGIDDDRHALSLLRRQLIERRTPSAGGPLSPIQVLDVADLCGQRFDAVRVMNVHADNWPPPARLNRLLPVDLARELPRSSAPSQRAFTSALQRGVLASSERVSFSWPVLADEVPTSPSPLLETALRRAETVAVANDAHREDAMTVPGGVLARAVWPGAGSDSARERDRLQVLPRQSAPPLGADTRRLSRVVKVLDHQSACPWVAFLVHRLGVAFPPPPSAFPGPAELGSGVHDALEALYRPYLGTGRRPAADEVPEAVDRALRKRRPSGPAGQSGAALEAVERRRLEALLTEWLDFEGRLPWPNPRDLEQRREAAFAGFELSVRMDRLDGLDGGALILDYKTGAGSAPAWGHERPTDLQLPLYAVLMAEAGDTPSGIGLLTVRRHDMKQTLWSGDASLKAGKHRSGVVIMGEGRAAFADWAGALAHWRQAVVGLLEEFRQGEASCLVHHSKPLAYLGLELLLRSGEGSDGQEDFHD